MNKGSESDQHNILKAYNMLLYFAGTMVMFDPAIECIHDFWTQGILKGLPVSSRNPRFIKAASQLRESVNDHMSRFEMMKSDYFLLFISQKDALAPPLESSFRKKGHRINNRLIPDVHEFYDSYGWVSKFKKHIADDHIGIELLFLTLMIEKLIEMDDEACYNEMKNEIKRFINQHIFSWVPEWDKRVQENAKTISYKGIATLIHASTEDIYNLLDETPDAVSRLIK